MSEEQVERPRKKKVKKTRPAWKRKKPGPRSSQPRLGAIYLITCIPTGEQYVGLTTKRDVRERWREHFRAARTQTHKVTALYTRMRQFSRNHFKCQILMRASEIELFEHERRLISELGTLWPLGLNMTPGGESSKKRKEVNGKSGRESTDA